MPTTPCLCWPFRVHSPRALILPLMAVLVLLMGMPPVGMAQDFPSVQTHAMAQGPALVERHPAPHWETVSLNVTAYCLQGTTATGVRVHHGIVAVDPAQFQFGTTLYVPGYGFSNAQDDGPAITQNHLDLWMPSCKEAVEWGRRQIEVEVLR